MYKIFFKRFFDLIVSLIAVIVLLPVLIIAALILMIVNDGNPFFLQTRPGKSQKAFKIIKFKTMTDERDKNGDLLPDFARITKVGNVVRRFSIDELPQLFNVLKGDMSLVGPRPLLFKYIPMYNQAQLRRHEVRPGITGLAQVNGRNSITWTEKFNYDTYYVDNISFMMDMRILFKTLLKVISQDGINQSADRPMQPFDGTN